MPYDEIIYIPIDMCVYTYLQCVIKLNIDMSVGIIIIIIIIMVIFKCYFSGELIALT